MFKKVATASISLVFLASPLFASAQSTELQAQIDALRAQVQQLLAIIAQLKGGQASPTSCVDLSSTLTLGSIGTGVTNLQNYLIKKGYLDAGSATGYFGFLTAQAVGKMQIALGLLSSESDPAYGFAGPKTRAAIGCTTIPTDPFPKSCPVPSVAACPTGQHYEYGEMTYDTRDCPITKMWCVSDSTTAPTCAYTSNSTGQRNGIAWNTGVAQTAGTCLKMCTIVRNEKFGLDDSGTCTFTGANGGQSIMSIAPGSTTKAPTCTLDVKTSRGLTKTGLTGTGYYDGSGSTYVEIGPGGWVTVTWHSTNATSATGPGGGPLTITAKDLTAGSETFYPGAQKAYEWTFYGDGGQAKCGVMVEILQSDTAQPSATIDQSSLNTSFNTPTITGTAINAQYLSISVYGYDGEKSAYNSGLTVSVVNGKWSTKPLSYLPFGTYTVKVSDTAKGELLTSGTLTVTALSCSVSDIFATQVSGYAFSNLYMKVKGLTVSSGQNVAITGADSWNSLLFSLYERGADDSVMLKANQTINATGVSYILARKETILPITVDGKTVTCYSISTKG